jgi:ribosome maturation protein SDO1
MTTLEDAVIARLKTHGANFEILVDCDKAVAFKGGVGDIKDALAVEKVFSDSGKGMLASETQMQQIFKTSDPLEVAKIIIRKGEIQFTADYRNKLREQKTKQIIDYIHRNGVDPRTHAPHPPQRIEAALEEAKVHIDEYKPADKQINDILKKITVILPIRFETKEIAVRIPSQYAGKAHSILASFGKIIKQEWQSDGSMVAVLEMPGGLEEEFHNKINSLTHGNAETKVLKTK